MAKVKELAKDVKIWVFEIEAGCLFYTKLMDMKAFTVMNVQNILKNKKQRKARNKWI